MSEIITLAFDAFEEIKEDTTPMEVRYPKGDYSERPLSYMVKLKGEKRWRRVYATPIGNVGVVYLKSGGKNLYCETALDHMLGCQERIAAGSVCGHDYDNYKA